MQRIVKFLKTSALGGLFVLLPLLLFYLLLSEALQAIVALATPIADLFPKEWFDKVEAPVVVALILILAASFAFGVILRSATLTRLGRRIEQSVLEKLPMYSAIRRLTRGLAGAENTDKFRPALFVSGENQREIVYVIEAHGDGRVTILVPWAPTPFAGSVKIVDSSQIEMLDAELSDVTRVLSLWGVGMSELMPGEGERLRLNKECDRCRP
jgi:uncharacterized membrane protein